jgi:acyl carrier protein
MDRQRLIKMMTELLQATLDDQNEHDRVVATPSLPLVGENAAITSMRLVSFIADLETTLASDYDLNLTLVSEQALSRQKSPFRSVDALADYILELTEGTDRAVSAA